VCAREKQIVFSWLKQKWLTLTNTVLLFWCAIGLKGSGVPSAVVNVVVAQLCESSDNTHRRGVGDFSSFIAVIIFKRIEKKARTGYARIRVSDDNRSSGVVFIISKSKTITAVLWRFRTIRAKVFLTRLNYYYYKPFFFLTIRDVQRLKNYSRGNILNVYRVVYI